MTGLTRCAPLAREAAASLQRRQELYPALVEKGALSAEKAAWEIRVWTAIAADWHWVVTMERREVPKVWTCEKIEALEDSVKRANRALLKAIDEAPGELRRQCQEGECLHGLLDRHGDDFAPILAAHHQRDRFIDLLDWYRRERPCSGQVPISFYVETNFALKERARLNREAREAA